MWWNVVWVEGNEVDAETYEVKYRRARSMSASCRNPKILNWRGNGNVHGKAVLWSVYYFIGDEVDLETLAAFIG